MRPSTKSVVVLVAGVVLVSFAATITARRVTANSDVNAGNAGAIAALACPSATPQSVAQGAQVPPKAPAAQRVAMPPTGNAGLLGGSPSRARQASPVCPSPTAPAAAPSPAPPLPTATTSPKPTATVNAGVPDIGGIGGGLPGGGLDGGGRAGY